MKYFLTLIWLLTPLQASELYQRFLNYDSYYEILNQLKPRFDESAVEVFPGTTKILLTAPHSQAHLRFGKFKRADRGSGPLALLLHESLGAQTIILKRRSGDGNFTGESSFRKILNREIQQNTKFVLDLHVSSPKRPYDVDLGTMHGRSLVKNPGIFQHFQHGFEKCGFQVSDNFFAASKYDTVTKGTSKMGIPTLQLEINGGIFIPPGERFPRFFHCLNELVAELSESL